MSKPEPITIPNDAATIAHVALDRLYLHEANPRQNVSDEDIAALADSIAAVGLLQNLCGVEDETGDKIGIVAGGRRLRALKLLATGDAAIDPIPVRIASDSTQAAIWAGAENETRAALTPAEEIRAYAAMVEQGHDQDAIARAFGKAGRHVAGRLRLANLAPVILTALETGDISLDTASAYTVSDDQERQAEVFASLGNGWSSTHRCTIKARLIGETDHQFDKLCTFIGRETYEKAGGVVAEDLFGDDIQFLDQELVTRLATEKLDAAAELATGERGWKWGEARIEGIDYQELQTYGRTYPASVPLSEKDAARYDELAAKVNQDDSTDAEREEFNALEEKEAATAYSGEQRAHAGVIITISHNGEVRFETGVVRPDDLDAAVEAGVCNPRAGTGSAGAGGDKPKEKPLYSKALAEDMAAIRTSAVQAALLAKPALAIDLLTFVLAARDSHTGVDTSHVSGGYGKAANDPEDATMTLPEFASFEDESLSGYQPDLASSFETFRGLAKKDKTAILTSCIARSIEGGLPGLVAHTGNPDGNTGLFESLGVLSGASVRKHWTPDEAFFKRLNKAQLVTVVTDTLADPEKTELISRAKKGEAAASIAKIFADPSAKSYGLSKEQIAKVKAWTPEKMGFEVDEIV